MGNAVWLYFWCVHAQTKANGLVLGGMPLTYAEISRRSRFPERRVRRWLDRLRQKGYVQVEYRNFKMMCLRVLKPKKFGYKQIPLPLTENGQREDSPTTKNGQSSVPKTVNGSTKSGQFKQSGSMKYIESTPTPLAHTVCTPVTRSEQEPKSARKENLPGFSLFWEAYPNKIGEAAALRSWLSTVRTDDAWPDILLGLELWKISPRWKNPRFIPNPARFLTEKYWLDKPPTDIPDERRMNGNGKGFSRSPAAVPPEPGKQYRQPVVLSTLH
jgi:hypothetical protein